MKICVKCDLCKPLDDFYIKDGKTTHSYCKSCVNKQTIERQRRLKSEAVKFMGGVCTICDGVFHNAAFEFHHPNGDKDYSIGNKKNLNIEHHKLELSKCVLVCSNCHKTLHAKY